MAREVVIFRKIQTFEANERGPAKRLLQLTRLNGDNLSTTASDEVWELAQELDPVQPVIVSMEVESTPPSGSYAYLRTVAMRCTDGAVVGDWLEHPRGAEMAQSKVQKSELAEVQARLERDPAVEGHIEP